MAIDIERAKREGDLAPTAADAAAAAFAAMARAELRAWRRLKRQADVCAAAAVGLMLGALFMWAGA